MFEYSFYKDTNEEIRAVEVAPLENYFLRVCFSNGEKRVFDVKTLFEMPVYSPLKNKALFSAAKIECDMVVWEYKRKNECLADDIDIHQEILYWDGIPENL